MFGIYAYELDSLVVIIIWYVSTVTEMIIKKKLIEILIFQKVINKLTNKQLN